MSLFLGMPFLKLFATKVDVDDQAEIAADAGVTAMPTFHCTVLLPE